MEDLVMLPMLRKRGNFPSLMDEFFGKDLMPNFFDFDNEFTTPAVNITEGADGYKIELAAPGIDKKDIKIDLDQNVLTISSENKQEKEDKDEKVMRKEFRYSAFSRSFTLPDTADYEKINASHKDGILTIKIPKKEESITKPARTINIG